MFDQTWAILERSFNELLARARHAAMVSQLRNPFFVYEAEPVAVGVAARPQSPAVEPPALRVVDGVAIIGVEGTLAKRLGWFEQRYLGLNRSMPVMQRDIEQAVADASVKAILLFVDSPGGTVADTSDLADAVYKARQTKTVYAYASDMMASAAYYVGSQADRVYTDRDALVGSIGTYMVVPDYARMAETEGVKVHVIRAGQFKGAGTPGTALTDEQLAEFQREIDGLNQVFLESVARGRRLSAERVAELATGQVWVGREAASAGLTDGVRPLDEVIAELAAVANRPANPNYVVIHEPPPVQRRPEFVVLS